MIYNPGDYVSLTYKALEFYTNDAYSRAQLEVANFGLLLPVEGFIVDRIDEVDTSDPHRFNVYRLRRMGLANPVGEPLPFPVFGYDLQVLGV